MIETNFKHTDIGLIPHDWEVKSLDSLFAFYAGGDIQKEYFSMTPQENKRYPIYSNSLENKGLYGYTSHPRYEANSITITGRGSLGHAEFRNHKFDAIVRLLVLQPKELVSGEFVTNTINFYMPFVFESTGVPQLTVPQTAKALIPLPPTLAEQERIAGALSSIDTLIGALNEQIEKKRHIKQGTMQQLLTGKKRLAGFTGEWKNEILLGEVIDIYKGQQVNNSELTDNNTTMFPMLNGGSTPSGYYDKYNTPAYSITISEGGNSCGYVNYMKESFWAGGHCYIVKPIIDTCKDFLYYVLKYREPDIMKLRVGSGLPNIQRKTLLKEIALLFPPTIAEQSAIAAVLSGMDTEIAALEQKRDKYIAIKSGMMQDLLTGKIRLV